MNQEELIKYFNSHKLAYQLFHHEPVFTVDEGEHLREQIPGAHSKNLFLKDKKGSFFLMSVLDHKKVDIKTLGRTYGKGGFSFAKAEDLMAKMRLLPGSVTPYGLLYDNQQEITFLLDEDFLKYPEVNFHPMRNDMTLQVNVNDFMQFFTLIKHPPIIVTVPEKKDPI